MLDEKTVVITSGSVASSVTIKGLQREDFGAAVKCIASNNNLTRHQSIENTFKINLMSKTQEAAPPYIFS